MRKHGGTPSRRDKHVTPAAVSPSAVALGRFAGGQQSGLAGCKPPPLFTRGGSFCSSQGRRQGEPWGASPRPSAPTYLPVTKLTASELCESANRICKAIYTEGKNTLQFMVSNTVAFWLRERSEFPSKTLRDKH